MRKSTYKLILGLQNHMRTGLCAATANGNTCAVISTAQMWGLLHKYDKK